MTMTDPELRGRAILAAREVLQFSGVDRDEAWRAAADAVGQVYIQAFADALPVPDRWSRDGRFPVWEDVLFLGDVYVCPAGVNTDRRYQDCTPDEVERAGRVLLAAAAWMRKGETS